MLVAAGEKKAQNNNTEKLGLLVVLLEHRVMPVAPAAVRTC